MPPQTIKSRLTVSHTELEGSPSITFTRDGVRGARSLKCDWADRFALVRQLLGLVQTTEGGVDDGTIRRPHQFPGLPSVVATSAAISPFDAKVTQDAEHSTEGVASYQYAMVDVVYEAVGWGGGDDDDGGPIFQESMEPSVQFIKVPGRKLYWLQSPDGETGSREPLDSDSAPGLLLRTFDYKVQLRGLTTVPDAVWDLGGGVNSTAVSSTRFAKTFEIGTLLYVPPKIKVSSTADGIPTVTLDFVFTYKPSGWNLFHKPGVVAPQPIFDESGNELKFYTEVDFSPLFNLF